MCELVGPNGLYFNETVRVGLWLQTKDVVYGPRKHAAEETFYIINGEAEWWTELKKTRLKGSGSYVFHSSNIQHKSITSDKHMFTAWRWSGDIGFDLILRDKLGNYIPVQCKYHSDRSRNVGWKEASTFFGLYNSSEEYQTAYLCSNAYGVSSNFESVNSKPIYRILGSDWSGLDSDFFSLLQQKLFGTKSAVEPYSPLPHQSKAISEALTYFNKQKHTRGKLIFPCGSGKSLTGYWLTRDLKSQTTLIAVPSLSLVKQTLDVYLRETVANGNSVEWLCICSDTDIGKSAEVKYSTEDLGIPSTTDPDKIKQWLTDTSGKDRFVFTTYQSGQIIAEVSKSMNLSFDLGIFDEAHKTVGNSDKLFSHLLFAKNINIDKRIFMTATERFYAGSKDEIASMDDVSISVSYTHLTLPTIYSV
mgnify:CR=1 FL=1